MHGFPESSPFHVLVTGESLPSFVPYQGVVLFKFFSVLLVELKRCKTFGKPQLKS